MSVFTTACSTPLPKNNRPALQEFDTTTVKAVAREDKYDPLIYCEVGASGLFGCPQPTQKTAWQPPTPPENPPSNVPHGTFDTSIPAPQAPISDVLFDFDKSVLTPLAQQDLTALLDVLRGKSLQLAGFTDSIGREAYNDRLALARANAVRDFLIAKGLPASVLEITGQGICCYVAGNDSDESRRLNRRVEIRLKGSAAREGAAGSTLPTSTNLNP